MLRLIRENKGGGAGNRPFLCRFSPCPDRNSFHFVSKCPYFLSQSPSYCASYIVDYGKCSVCLNNKHDGGEKNCKFFVEKNEKFRCVNCNGYHTPAVCPQTLPADQKSKIQVVFCGAVGSTPVFKISEKNDFSTPCFSREFLTAGKDFRIDSNVGKNTTLHLFYDLGSSMSFIRADMAKKLNLKKIGETYLQIQGVNHMTTLVELKDVFEMTFFPSDQNKGKKPVKVNLVALDEITELTPPANCKEIIKELNLGQDVCLSVRSGVDLLLGCEAVDLHPAYGKDCRFGSIFQSKITKKFILVGGGGRAKL